MKKLNVGMIGLGNIANMHYKAISECDRITIKAICTRSKANLEDRAKEWGIEKTYTDYTQLINDDEIDAVVISTPPNLHAKIALQALKAGKHVFCEKPPALSADEAFEMKKAAEENGVVLMYGFMFRFSEKHNFVKDFCTKDLMGDIYYARGKIINRYSPHNSWFTKKEISGGGPLMDYGPHIVDLCTYLLGDHEPVTVFARSFSGIENMDSIKHTNEGYFGIDRTKNGNDVEEMDVLMVTFDNGSCIHIETSFNSHIKETGTFIELLGTKAGMQVDPKLEMYSVINETLVDIIPKVNCGEWDYQQSMNDEFAHFAACVLDGAVCRAGADVGLKFMRIADAAYLSAKTGESVNVAKMVV